MIVYVHIDRLSVDGLTAADARRIGEAVQGHLARLARCAAAPLRPTPRRLERLDGTVPPGAPATDIGRHVATQIFQGMTGSGRA